MQRNQAFCDALPCRAVERARASRERGWRRRLRLARLALRLLYDVRWRQRRAPLVGREAANSGTVICRACRIFGGGVGGGWFGCRWFAGRTLIGLRRIYWRPACIRISKWPVVNRRTIRRRIRWRGERAQRGGRRRALCKRCAGRGDQQHWRRVSPPGPAKDRCRLNHDRRSHNSRSDQFENLPVAVIAPVLLPSIVLPVIEFESPVIVL